MVNSVDPDQTPRSAASDQGLHCLSRHVCLNTKTCSAFDKFQKVFFCLVLYTEEVNFQTIVLLRLSATSDLVYTVFRSVSIPEYPM